MSGSHLSKDFFEFIKAIGESRSKQEEDTIVVAEVARLKQKMQEPGAAKRMKEYLVRAIYVEMLGHDASFGYIRAVEMCASSNLMHKRVGYLCASLCLDPNHEFRMMLVNQMTRDMRSANHLEVGIALLALSKLLTREMVPAVLDTVAGLLTHERETVRKKAVMTLHRFHQLDPSSVAHMGDKFRRALCDRDPAVMGAALNLLHDVAVGEPVAYKDLVPSFVSILKQITEHRLPRDFDYHRMPAPWIQIKLLRILATLGHADQRTSEGMYEVLHDVMRRADTGINVGYAVIYECVLTITAIYPNATLLDAAAAAISRFVTSDSHNLKYLGVTGLAAIVKDHPQYAAPHQLAVIECLEDPDETLKRKTLDLLFRMTNPVNVEVVVDKLTAFLRTAVDEFLRTDLVQRITQLAERYAPSTTWFIRTMTLVFELGGELVRPETAHNLMRLLAEGSGEDEEADAGLRQEAVATYLRLMRDNPTLPDVLVQVIAWVVGEYGHQSEEVSLPEVLRLMCDLAARQQLQPETRGMALTAVAKLCAQLGSVPPEAQQVMTRYASSRHPDLQQRAREALALADALPLMRAVLPVDASCEDVDVPADLPFLNAFVSAALEAGAKPYMPPEDSDSEDEAGARPRRGSGAGLRFDAYAAPVAPTTTYPGPSPSAAMAAGAGFGAGAGTGAGGTAMGGSGGAGAGAGAGGSTGGASVAASAGLNLSGVRSVWGAEGFKGNVATAGAAAAALPHSQPAATSQGPAKESGGGWQGVSPAAAGLAQEPARPEPAAAPASSAAAARARVETEQEEREVSEKQRMATALFGGIVSATRPGEPATGSRRGGLGAAAVGVGRGARRPAGAAAQQQRAAAGDDDLLGLGGAASTPASTAATAGASAAASNSNGASSDLDLLSLYASPTTSAATSAATAAVSTAPAAAASAAAGDSLDMGGLLGALDAGTPVKARAGEDVFGALDLLSPVSPVHTGHTDPTFARLRPALAAELGGVGPAWEQNKMCGKDEALAVAYNLFLHADGVAVAVFAAASAPLGHLMFSCEPPAGLDARATFDAGAQPASPVRAALPALERGMTFQHVVHLVPKLALEAPPRLSGRISYHVEGRAGSATLQFNIQLAVLDFVRPLHTTTAEFGKQWRTHAAEKKFRVAVPGVATPEAMLQAFSQRCSVYGIQAIQRTNDGIAAGQLVGKHTQVLVYGKVVRAEEVDVTVRTPDAGMSTAVAAEVAQRLAGK